VESHDNNDSGKLFEIPNVCDRLVFGGSLSGRRSVSMSNWLLDLELQTLKRRIAATRISGSEFPGLIFRDERFGPNLRWFTVMQNARSNIPRQPTCLNALLEEVTVAFIAQ
jgi:hypothetical protein